MTQENQMAPTPTVNRSRFRSATDDPARHGTFTDVIARLRHVF